MPWSNPENQQWVLNKVVQLKPQTILDVGAGYGTYARLLRPYVPARYVAIEIFENYISEYKLKELYDEVWLEDVRKYVSLESDLIIFGDVLEHMSKEQTIDKSDLDLVLFTDSIPEAMEHIQKHSIERFKLKKKSKALSYLGESSFSTEQ